MGIADLGGIPAGVKNDALSIWLGPRRCASNTRRKACPSDLLDDSGCDSASKHQPSEPAPVLSAAVA